MNKERKRQSNDIEVIIKNMNGRDLHFVAKEGSTVDLLRGISELNQLYTVSIELNSLEEIESWVDE